MSKNKMLCVLTGSFVVSPYGDLLDVIIPDKPMVIGGVDYLDYYGITLTPYTAEEEALDMMENDLEHQLQSLADNCWTDTVLNNNHVFYQPVVSNTGKLALRIEVHDVVIMQEVKGVVDTSIGFMLGKFIE